MKLVSEGIGEFVGQRSVSLGGPGPYQSAHITVGGREFTCNPRHYSRLCNLIAGEEDRGIVVMELESGDKVPGDAIPTVDGLFIVLRGE